MPATLKKRDLCLAALLKEALIGGPSCLLYNVYGDTKGKEQRMIKLDARLRSVAGYVEEGAPMADIGCDHGRLCAALLQQGRVTRGIAVDRSASSLEKTRRLAGRLGLNGRLDCRRGDGLGPLIPDEAASIVIAGLSGMGIARMLGRGAEKIGKARLILQPMQGEDALRRALIETGMHILDEDLVARNGRLFDVIVAGREQAPAYDLAYAQVGFRLWQKRHPLLKARVLRRLAVRKKLIADLQKSGAAESETLRGLYASVRLYEEMLGCL